MNEPLLTPAELAEYLRVHPKTIERLCASGKLKFRLVASRKRFSFDDINAYLNRHRPTPSSPEHAGRVVKEE